ncbi:DUF4870 domain-containing protein [Candidatus Woesebacteria bacterium]|nr:DUF4870 domain-containing protein [Candidatus Woesebacteria bacterium]
MTQETQAPQIQPAPDTAKVEMSVKDRNLWATIAHLSSLCGFLIPFGNVVGPLVVWLIKKDDSVFVGEHALAALNFQITVMIGLIISFFLTFIFIGVLLMPLLAILDLVFVIKATMAANKGEHYEYPYSLHLVK